LILVVGVKHLQEKRNDPQTAHWRRVSKSTSTSEVREMWVEQGVGDDGDVDGVSV